MAGSVNTVILVGNLGKHPELKYGQQSGKAVCRFTLATSERWGGEEKTEWHNVVCFNRTAEIANEYLTKGQQVYVEGRLTHRRYQGQDGQERYITEILVDKLTLLGGARRDSNYSPSPWRQESSSSSTSPAPMAPAFDPFKVEIDPIVNDDDMPF